MNKFFQLLCVLALLFNFKIVFAACEKETTSYIETTRSVSDGVLQRTGHRRFTFENHKSVLNEWIKVGGPYKSTTWMVPDINAVIAGETQAIESLKKDMHIDGVNINSAWMVYRLCFMRAEARGVFAEVANTHLASRDLSSLNAGNSSSQQPNQQNQSTQQQSQQAQQQAQQAQDAARVAQTRADQARQGQRRRHEPENEASQCIQPDFGGLFGGMKNTCDFKVWYTYCGYRPKESSWLTGMNCEKQSFGSDSVGPGRTSASHTKGVESIHWIACKEPAWALDAEFVPGQGIKGRCHTVGGK